MSINRDALIQKLQSLLDITYAVDSSNVDDVLASALASDALSRNNIIVVSNKDDLPNLKYYNSPSGMLYYIDNIDVFAVSSNNRWLTLDGRVIRQDTFVATAFSWGCNTAGQLGDNTTVSKSSPVSVVGGFTDWCQTSAGIIHSLGLRTNGTLWAWGSNISGRLGDGTIVNKSSPVSVVGGFTDWCQVSAGRYHSLGLRTNGTLWAWGCNGTGQLGDNTATNRSSPVSVIGGFTDWCQVSAGRYHNLALRTNGTAWAWGCNAQGRLGDNTIVNQSSPVSVVGGFTDWCQASAGDSHSLAVRANGTLWAWGCSGQGRLGDNTATNRSSPVSVVGGFADWCRVSAGRYHSLGVRQNGTLWAWGCNGTGQLGNGNIDNRSSPVSVIGGFTDWCQASAGACHSLAVRQNGTAWAWGCNAQGRLGDNTIVNQSSPVSVVGGFTDWCQAIASDAHSIGLRIR